MKKTKVLFIVSYNIFFSADYEVEQSRSEAETNRSQDSTVGDDDDDGRAAAIPNEEQLIRGEYESTDDAEHRRYFYGKNRFKWSSMEPLRNTRRHNIVDISQQVIQPVFQSFEDLWELFFSVGMIEMIVRHTNEKLDSYRVKFKDTGRTELGATNEMELRAFIGLLFCSSVFQSNHENAEFIYATNEQAARFSFASCRKTDF